MVSPRVVSAVALCQGTDRLPGPASAPWGAEVTLMAALVTWVGLILLRWAAPALRLVDRPHGRHTHAAPAARVGGIAVALASATILAGWPVMFESVDQSQLACVALAFAVGLADDLLGGRMPWFVKLGLQGVVAGAYAMRFEPLEGTAAAAVLVLAMNAANFFDHSNLLLGLAVLPGLTLAPGGAAWVLPAALLAFLVSNARGRVFAGDAGSHGFGFAAAAFALGDGTQGAPAEFTRALVVLCLPILDATFVVVRRISKGRPPWVSTPDHLADRLRRRFGTAGFAAMGTFVVSASMGWIRWEHGNDAWTRFGWIPVVLALVLVGAGSPPWRPRTAAALPKSVALG